MTTLGGSCGFSVVFVNVCITGFTAFFQKIGQNRRRKKKTRRLAYQIPPFLLDRIRLAFCDEGPHEVGNGHFRVKLKVEREVVLGRVEEVDESPAELEAELQEVVARSEREDGVQRGDGASASREYEEITVAIRGQVDTVAPARRWTRELLLEDVYVSTQPVVCIYACQFFWPQNACTGTRNPRR